MKTDKINWAIIGPGKIARKFATSLREVEDANLYAVASRSLDRATVFAEEFGAKKIFGSYEEMLQDKNIDVVYVATPHSFHHEHTLLCLNHGKPVLCEKPFAMNREQVEEMIATAQKNEVFLMEALWTPFLPHIKYVKEVIDSGKFGKVATLNADFGFNSPFNENGRLFRKSLGGGSLLDIGLYPVFLALHTLGIPDKMSAAAQLGRTGIDELCDINFEYKNGAKAFLQSSIIQQTPTIAEIELEKAKISIKSKWHEPSEVTIISAQGTTVKDFDVASFGYEYEARHVQEMLRLGKKESDVMTFDKSRELISMLDKIRKQIHLEYYENPKAESA